MSILSSKTNNSFFTVDIGSTSVRVVHLKGAQVPKKLSAYASVPIDPKSSQSDSSQSQEVIQKALKQLIKDANISEKNVVAGIPSDRIFAAVVDFPNISEKELKKTIEYQLDTHVPMPLDEVKVDWKILGTSPVDKEKVEVLIVSLSNDYAESRLELFESMGLNVIAFEPDALGLTRSLVAAGNNGASLIMDIGYNSTDLVVAIGNTPRLIRSVPVGGTAFLKAVAQNLNLDNAQAQEFIHKFGMNSDKVEGQIYRALEGTVGSLMSEVQKSIKFFSDRYTQIGLDRIIVTGGSAGMPGLPLHIANTTGIQVEIGNPWQNVSYPADRYNELVALSSQYAVGLGLGLRVEE